MVIIVIVFIVIFEFIKLQVFNDVLHIIRR